MELGDTPALGRQLIAVLRHPAPFHPLRMAARRSVLRHYERTACMERQIRWLQDFCHGPMSTTMSWWTLVIRSIEAEQWPVAEGALLRMIDSHGPHPDLLDLLAYALLMQGRYLRCEAVIRQAIELGTKNFWSPHKLGDALRAQQRMTEAAAAYEQALAWGSDSPLTVRNLLEVLHRLNHRQALERLEAFASSQRSSAAKHPQLFPSRLDRTPALAGWGPSRRRETPPPGRWLSGYASTAARDPGRAEDGLAGGAADASDFHLPGVPCGAGGCPGDGLRQRLAALLPPQRLIENASTTQPSSCRKRCSAGRAASSSARPAQRSRAPSRWAAMAAMRCGPSIRSTAERPAVARAR